MSTLTFCVVRRKRYHLLPAQLCKREVLWNTLSDSQVSVILMHPQIKSGFYSPQMSSNTEGLSYPVLEWNGIASGRLGKVSPLKSPCRWGAQFSCLPTRTQAQVLLVFLQFRITFRYCVLHALKSSIVVMLWNVIKWLCLRFSYWNVVWGSRKVGTPIKTLLKFKSTLLYSWWRLIY